MNLHVLLICLSTLSIFSFSFTAKSEVFTGEIKGYVYDAQTLEGVPFASVYVEINGKSVGTLTDIDGYYSIEFIPAGKYTLTVSFVGYETFSEKIKLSGNEVVVKDVYLEEGGINLEEVVTIRGSRAEGTEYYIDGIRPRDKKNRKSTVPPNSATPTRSLDPIAANSNSAGVQDYEEKTSTEQYEKPAENTFITTEKEDTSTFSIDVDGASLSNVRRFLMRQNQLPPSDAVRVEELINYFPYNYTAPEANAADPFSIYTELSDCPWNANTRLLHIGLKAKNIATYDLPPSNLVFLIDVSGSMNNAERLPLLKKAFTLLVHQMRDEDKISMVVYAGAAGVVLPPTSGKDKEKIYQAIDNLQAGGSTAGGAGIELAYKTAEENLLKNGNNRIILATDGDFNVGISNDNDLVKMIEEKRQKGIFLTVLGFGMGNYKDAKMEKLADKGNGNYYYIDDFNEARKVLITQMNATLFTVAKDVKTQVIFNPKMVKAYRLVGYENRLLANEDFDDDTKDAGEMGAGHSVTALYELELWNTKNANTASLLELRFRYKQANGDESKLLTKNVSLNLYQPLAQSSDDFRFSAAVAMWGMLLSDSAFKAEATYEKAFNLAEKSQGTYADGMRSSLVNLIRKTEELDK